MHPYNILEIVCEDNDWLITIMAGATVNHTTFSIWNRKKDNRSRLIYGTCTDSVVTLGVTGSGRTEYDLCNPKSILEITKHIYRVIEE